MKFSQDNVLKWILLSYIQSDCYNISRSYKQLQQTPKVILNQIQIHQLVMSALYQCMMDLLYQIQPKRRYIQRRTIIDHLSVVKERLRQLLRK